MKSIEELRAKTIPLPCSFAGEAGTGEVADFPTLGTDTDPYTSYKSGFPEKFATTVSYYKVNTSVTSSENTEWASMDDKVEPVVEEYKSEYAYSAGDFFLKRNGANRTSCYSVTENVTAEENDGIKSIKDKLREITGEYFPHVGYVVGDLFCRTFPQDHDVLRKDMNKVGELATAELHFKEAGMNHKFQADLLNSIVGYPLLCLFGYFDGEYLKHIESQSRDNAVNFTANPLCIDNYVAATVGGEKKIYWKTVDKIYGLDEDLFRLEVDYSRVDKLQPTDTLKEDSLIVIGDYGYPGEGSVITPASASLTLTVGDQTIEFDNKGRCGIKIGNVSITESDIVIDDSVPYPEEMCGYGNSTVVFYAKKGTAVSYKFDDGQADSAGTNVFAFPVILKVGKTSGGELQ